MGAERTLILQSYRTRDVPAWIERCMASVRSWATDAGHDYEFVGDELLDLAPAWYRERAAGFITVVTDLARLILLRDRLASDACDLAVWVDADVLVMRPGSLRVEPTGSHAFCREVWVDRRRDGSPALIPRINNAACAFRRSDAFLPYYIGACQATLRRDDLTVSHAVVGTDALTKLYDAFDLELLPGIALLSPWVERDILEGGGPFLDAHRRTFPGPVMAANLTASADGLDDAEMDRLVALLAADSGRALDPDTVRP